MFRPIKNFFNYIQKKNATNGNDADTNLTNEQKLERIEVNSNLKSDTQIGYNHKMEETTTIATKKPTVTTTEILTSYTSVDGEEDDIEMQIKTSVMIKKPLLLNGNVNPVDIIRSKANGTLQTCHQDHNQNHRQKTDTMSIVEEICAAGNANIKSKEIDCDNEEEMGLDEPFLDLTNPPKSFTGEIIVLGETDLNTSLNNDTLSEDPLAIDDLAIKPDTIAISSVSGDDSDLLWIDLDGKLNENDETNIQKDTTVAVALNNTKITGTSSIDDTVEELRSDGSDSGLGSETSVLNTDTSQILSSTSSTPMRSPLATQQSIQSDNINIKKCKPSRSNLKRHHVICDDTDGPIAVKKQKRSINFDGVEVYYFPRQQGFCCVPSAGGCTLGMGANHVAFKTLTLAEHIAEIRRHHRTNLQDNNSRGLSSDDTDESEEDFVSEGSGSDVDTETVGYLQPISPKQRRVMLKAAGVRKIDASEKIECRDIRNSRERCGCNCREFCDPETCACSQSGIKCQVDRTVFPCGCTRDACGNPIGRIEFNPARVRTHYIHTLMRLNMENRQTTQTVAICAGNVVDSGGGSNGGGGNDSNVGIGNGVDSSVGLLNFDLTTPSTSNQAATYYGMQTPSNYSSGYASPAYSNEQTNSYYQQQIPTYINNQANVVSYPLDSLDNNIFPSSTTNNTSYVGDILSPYTAASTAYQNLNYNQSTLTYSAYHIHQNLHDSTDTNYLPTSQHNISTQNNTTYSSCAVPSLPPFGAATTTEASSQYHGDNSLPLISTPNTTTTNCTTIHNVGGDSRNIDNNIDINATHSLVINDLLGNSSDSNIKSSNIATMSSASTTKIISPSCIQNDMPLNTISDSINTPPIEELQKNCLSFNVDTTSTQIKTTTTANAIETTSEPSIMPTKLLPSESISGTFEELITS